MRGAHGRHAELPLAIPSGPGYRCSFPARCQISAVTAEGLGTWCLLEPVWDESALEEAQTPHRVSVRRAGRSSVASCGTSDSLQGFPVSLGSVWKYHPHSSPWSASGCSARGSRSDSLFPCVPVPWDFQKLCSGLWYLLGAINAIKREEKHIWEEAVAAPAPR